jgi:hypothetical protein
MGTVVAFPPSLPTLFRLLSFLFVCYPVNTNFEHQVDVFFHVLSSRSFCKAANKRSKKWRRLLRAKKKRLLAIEKRSSNSSGEHLCIARLHITGFCRDETCRVLSVKSTFPPIFLPSSVFSNSPFAQTLCPSRRWKTRTTRICVFSSPAQAWMPRERWPDIWSPEGMF